MISRPSIPLKLNYLISFHGETKSFIPEILMGAVVRYLNAYPVLIPDSIRDITSDNLSESNLADSPDRVRFTLLSMTTEEMSKLWSVFFQTPYALSVAYEASVVVLDADIEAAPAPPVLRRGADDQGVNANASTDSVFPWLANLHIGPASDLSLKPLPRSFPAADISHTLILQGNNLSGESVALRFQRLPGDEPFKVILSDRNAPQIIAYALDTYKNWQVGNYRVEVVVTQGERSYTSNTIFFTLSPKITEIGISSGYLTLKCLPAPGENQAVNLLLLDQVITADSVPNGELIFDISTLPPTTGAVVRLRVDGIDSLPFEREPGNPQGLRFADNQKVVSP